MKRVITAGRVGTNDIYTGEKVISVIKSAIAHGWPMFNPIKTDVAKGIQQYKQNTSVEGRPIEFHHIDLDTSNNSSDNILLVSKDAQTAIHNNDDRWMRHYQAAKRPTYPQGRRFEESRRKVWNSLGDDLGRDHTLTAWLDILAQHMDVLGPAVDVTAATRKILSDADAAQLVVTKSDVQRLLDQSEEDFTKLVDVTDVDDEVGDEILRLIEDQVEPMYTDKMHRKSIQIIKEFIRTNSTNRRALSDAFERGDWKHSM